MALSNLFAWNQMEKAAPVSSCIIARGEETFANDYGMRLMEQWNIPEGYVARCFVLLGYCSGPYPQVKARKAGRIQIVE